MNDAIVVLSGHQDGGHYGVTFNCTYCNCTFKQLKFGYLNNVFSKTNEVQSTLVISKSKGHSEILRDVRTLTY